MSIGRGWYEDEIGEIESDELRDLAVILLSQKLDEIFKKISEIPRENRLVMKGTCY